VCTKQSRSERNCARIIAIHNGQLAKSRKYDGEIQRIFCEIYARIRIKKSSSFVRQMITVLVLAGSYFISTKVCTQRKKEDFHNVNKYFGANFDGHLEAEGAASHKRVRFRFRVSLMIRLYDKC
jgi:hypothetical protein